MKIYELQRGEGALEQLIHGFCISLPFWRLLTAMVFQVLAISHGLLCAAAGLLLGLLPGCSWAAPGLKMCTAPKREHNFIKETHGASRERHFVCPGLHMSNAF